MIFKAKVSSHISEISFQANLVLQGTVERAYFSGEYGESKKEVFVIRGENVVLMGRIVCTSLLPRIKELKNGEHSWLL